MNHLMRAVTIVCIYSMIINELSAQNKKVPLEDYSIPDAPAFSIMNSTPTTILRPSTGRELAIAIGNQFFSKQNSCLAVEYSPHVKLSFSVGIQNGSTGEVSIGTRWNIIDDIDAQSNDQVEVLRKLMGELRIPIDRFHLVAIDSLMKKYNCDTITVLTKYNDDLNTLQNDLITQSKKSPTYDSTLNVQFKKNLEEMIWNKSILTMAIAYRNNYSASSIDNASFGHDNKLQFWCTYSYGIGKLIKLDIGTTGGIVNNGDTSQKQFGVGLKAIYDTKDILRTNANTFRIELGAEFKYYDKKLDGNRVSIDRPLSFYLGMELKVFDNNWMVFQIAKDAASTKYIPKIEYKSGI